MENLFGQFARHFPTDRSTVLLQLADGSRLSYAEALGESARLANYLMELGLHPGDRVTVQAPKNPMTLWLYLACLRSGLIFHPLNDAYLAEELKYFIEDAEPALVVCAPARLELFRSLCGGRNTPVLTIDDSGAGSLADASAASANDFQTIAVADDDVAALLYSSGTTGRPKGAMITHTNLAANIRTLTKAWSFTRDDHLLHALPTYHAHGLFVGVGCVLMSGASMSYPPSFDTAQVVELLPGATVMMGVPTYYTRLLGYPAFDRDTCRNMRLFISGSAPLRAETFAEFRDRSGHDILERYGLTETGMNSANPLDAERRPGSVGHALPGVQIRVADDRDRPLASGAIGEVQISGPNVFRGYWRMPEKTAEVFTADGFFRTGDQGMFGEGGYLSIVGRGKDMIISGGLNVYPREVESVLDELPGVAESAVIGVPHQDFGEAVVAVVVAQQDEPPKEQVIIAKLRDRLANFKLPKRVFQVSELPRNAMGKVQKSLLRQTYSQVFE